MSHSARRSVTPRRRTAGGDSFHVRSPEEIAKVTRRWSKHVQTRARELFKKSELNDLLTQVAQGIEQFKDPILGRADECVLWSGTRFTDGWAGIRVPKMGQEGSTITPLNRFLVFTFASDEIFHKLKGPPKAAPFEMSCTNRQCICIAHVSLDAVSRKRSSSRARSSARQIEEVQSRVDFFFRLPFGMCERVLMFCSYNGVKEARSVSQCWKDAVTCFLIPNEAEQRLLIAWNELWRAFLLVFQRTRNRSLLMGFSAPWVHELCVKLLGLFDAMVPDGTMDRQTYEKCLALWSCMELRLSIRISLMVLEEVHTKLRRQALDTNASFPWPEFGGVYGAVMRKSANMAFHNEDHAMSKTGMNRWKRDMTLPYRLWMFDTLDWYAGGSGCVKRDDIVGLLSSVEALLVERRRGAWVSAIDGVMVWARSIPENLRADHAGDVLASACLAPAYALSQVLRHVYDLASDPEVVEAVCQDIPVIGTAGSVPHHVSTLLRGERVVTRRQWRDVVRVIVQFPPLVWLRQHLPTLLPDNLFEPDFAELAYEKFLSLVGGSIDEETFVRNATPSLKSALGRCGQVLQDHASELLASRIFEMFKVYENPETLVEEMLQKLEQAVQDRVESFAPEFASHLFSILNINNDGALTTQELNRGRCVFRAPSLEEALEKTFDVVDINQDGRLQPEELGAFVRKVLDVLVTVMQLIFESIGVVVAGIFKEHAGAIGDIVKESRRQFEIDEVRNYELVMLFWSFIFRASSELMISPWALAPIRKMGGAAPTAGSKMDRAVRRAIYEGGAETTANATKARVFGLAGQEMSDEIPRLRAELEAALTANDVIKAERDQLIGQPTNDSKLRAELDCARKANEVITAERDHLLAELTALRQQLAPSAAEPELLAGLEPDAATLVPTLSQNGDNVGSDEAADEPELSSCKELQEAPRSIRRNTETPRAGKSFKSFAPSVRRTSRMSLVEDEFLKPGEDIEVGPANGSQGQDNQSEERAVEQNANTMHVDVVNMSGISVLSLEVPKGSSGTMTVGALKRQLAYPSGIPAHEQQLLVGSQILKNKERLDSADTNGMHRDKLTLTVLWRSTWSTEIVAEREVLKLGFTPVAFPPDDVIVKSVDAGSWAERQGVVAGDQLIEVNEQLVSAMGKQDLKRVMTLRPIRLAFNQSRSTTGLSSTAPADLSASLANAAASPSASSGIAPKSRTLARSSRRGSVEQSAYRRASAQRVSEQRIPRERRRSAAASRSSCSLSHFGMASSASMHDDF